MLSWIGLGENQTFAETFNMLFESSLENIEFAEGVTISINKNFYIEAVIRNLTNRIFVPHGLCKVYELNRPLRYVRIILKDEHSGFEYFAFFSDAAAAIEFQMPYSLLTGDRIRFDVTPVKKYVDYKIQLKEKSVETGDGSCVDYPTNYYESYAECVDAEVRRKILPALGCMVPWMSLKGQCSSQVPRVPSHEDLLQWLRTNVLTAWGGSQYESETCPLPCTLLSGHANYLQSGSGTSYNYIGLYFDANVKVEHIVWQYDLGDLVVEVGSSLGLWLGKITLKFYTLSRGRGWKCH